MTTLQSLVSSFRSRGTRKAVGFRAEYGLRWWTYEQLHRNVCRVAWVLQQREIPAGSHILMWCDNCPEWVAFLLGAALRGITVAVVDAAMPPERVAEVAARLKPALLICGPGQDPRCVPGARLRLHIFDGDGESGSMEELAVPVDPRDAAVVVFTSGSSQAPRGVILTHRNLMCQANRFWYWRYVVDRIPIRLLALSPLSHVQGLMLAAVVPLSLGLSVIHTGSFSPPHLIRTIREDRVTVLSTVPRVLELLEETLMKESFRASVWGRRWALFRGMRRAMGWRFLVVLTGGATLPRAREKFWGDSCCVMVQGYGSTETTAFVTVNRPFAGRFGSIGLPVDKASVRIADDGEILVRGPSLSPGYWDEQIRPLDLTPDGYLRTGDLASRDTHNRLFFKGRKNELIVTAEGLNVQPQMVENALRESAGVRDAVVFGCERNGMEEVHAVLLMAQGGSAAEAVRRANARLLPFERVRNWSVWPGADFPRGMLEKVVRNEVIARTAGKRETSLDPPPLSLAEIAAAPDRQMQIEWLAAYVARTSQVKTSDGVLEIVRGLDLDSIAFVQLLVRLEATWGVSLSAPQSSILPDASPYRKEPVRWYHALGWNPIRRVMRGALLAPYMNFRFDLAVRNADRLRTIRPPCVLALSSRQARDSLDYLALFRALPRRMATRLFLGTSLLGLDPQMPPENSAARFAQLFFPFVPIPRSGATMSGLLQVCEWMDRGYHPVLTWRMGAAVVALQTHASVIPVHLSRGAQARQVQITFGEPFVPGMDLKPDQVLQSVENELERIEKGSR